MDNSSDSTSQDKDTSSLDNDRVSESRRQKRSATTSSADSSIGTEEDRIRLAQAQLRARSRSLTMQLSTQRLIETLQRELEAARDELAKRNERCEQLTLTEGKMRNELEDLTQSLFEEANKMVEEAVVKQSDTEKQLRSYKRTCEELTMQVETLRDALAAAQQHGFNAESQTTSAKRNWNSLLSTAKLKKDTDSKKGDLKTSKKEESYTVKPTDSDVDATRRSTLPVASNSLLAGDNEEERSSISLLRLTRKPPPRNSGRSSFAEIRSGSTDNDQRNGLRRFQSLFNRQRSTDMSTSSQSADAAEVKSKTGMLTRGGSRDAQNSATPPTRRQDTVTDENNAKTNDETATTGSTGNNLPFNARRIEHETDAVIDKRTYMEFSDWLLAPTLDENASPFLCRIFNQDVKPCLQFTVFERDLNHAPLDSSKNAPIASELNSTAEDIANSQPAAVSNDDTAHTIQNGNEKSEMVVPSDVEQKPSVASESESVDRRLSRTEASRKITCAKLVRAIKSNRISISRYERSRNVVSSSSPTDLESQFCLLDNSRLEHVEYQVRLTDSDDETEGAPFFVCAYARQRLIAACELYTYLSYIERGIKKQSELTMFNEIARLRVNLCMAKLGIQSDRLPSAPQA